MPDMTPRLINKFVLFAMVIAVSGCIRAGQRSLVKEDVSTPVWLFAYPDCLPECTAEHKRQRTENSLAEATIVAAIDAAESTLDFSMYTFSRRPIYDALVRAGHRGVRVRGIVDRGQFRQYLSLCDAVSGCDFSQQELPDRYEMLSMMEKETWMSERDFFRAASNTEKLALLFWKTPDGSAIKPAPGSRRLVHNKYVIADGKVLVSGSGNWSSTAVSINLENLARVDSDHNRSVVQSFQCSFDVLWTGDANRFQRELRSCETDDVKFAPAPRREAGAVDMVLNRIQRAETSIDIAMHHLVHRDVIQKLIEARGRGVAVRLLFDDDDCNGRPDENLLALFEAGAEHRYMQTNCKLFQLSHNKFGVFDRQIAVNGSGNWGAAGMTRNYENFVQWFEPEDVTPFVTFFDRAWSNGVELNACQCGEDNSCRERMCLSVGN